MTESQWTFVRNEHNKITSLPNGFVFRGDLLLFHIFGIIDLLYAKDIIQLVVSVVGADGVLEYSLNCGMISFFLDGKLVRNFNDKHLCKSISL